MRSLNKAQIIGHCGKDCDLRYTTSGIAVANFTVATSEQWKDADGNAQEKTEWHNIVAWKKLAEICGEYVKKGMRVYVEGRLQTRSYDDKNTGTKKYITEIVADNLIMLDGKKGEAQAEPAQETPVAKPGKDDDNLPF